MCNIGVMECIGSVAVDSGGLFRLPREIGPAGSYSFRTGPDPEPTKEIVISRAKNTHSSDHARSHAPCLPPPPSDGRHARYILALECLGELGDRLGRLSRACLQLNDQGSPINQPFTHELTAGMVKMATNALLASVIVQEVAAEQGLRPGS